MGFTCFYCGHYSATDVVWNALLSQYACVDVGVCLARDAMRKPTDTSLDFDFDEEDTQPFGLVYPPAQIGSMISPPPSVRNGDHLPTRKCKKCGNFRVHALLQHDNWYAFCKLCSHREGL